MPGKPDEIIKRFDQFASERTNWDQNWQDIADYELGRRDFTVERSPGERRDSRIFDGTAAASISLLASSLHGMMTNPSTKWFSLKIDDDYLDQQEAVQIWLEETEDVLYAVFGDPESRHSQTMHEFYLDLASFASAGMFIGDRPGKGVLFSSRALSELYPAENAAGAIETIYRKFALSAIQAKQEFGANTPNKVLKAIEAGKPEERFWFLHAVYPREDRLYGKQDRLNMPFASCYVSLADKSLVSEGGFHEFPYIFGRWSKDPGEIFGRGPGWDALPDTKMLHAMSKTTIRAAQKSVDPPLLVSNEGVMLPVRTVPGGLNFGRLDQHDFIRPLQSDYRIDIGLEMMDQRRKAIRGAFFADVLEVMRDPRMTAAQVYAIQGELMRVMGPVFGRLQSEVLGPMIDRTYAILSRAGALPTPPQELSGRTVRVEYVSPLAKAQKASEAQAVLRTYEPAMQLAALDPGIMDNFDHDKAIRVVAEANGMPMKIMRDPQEVAAIREQRAKAQQQAQNLAAAESLAGTGATAVEGLKGLTEMMQPPEQNA